MHIQMGITELQNRDILKWFHGGIKRPGRDADPSPRSSAVGHERVELYLSSPYGPYGLYRA